MPTYKSLSTKPLELLYRAGTKPRVIEPGMQFVAHPDEVQASYLHPIPPGDFGKGRPALLEKLADIPLVASPLEPPTKGT